MTGSLIPDLVSGAAFGAALTVSGLYQPAVMISQLRLENNDMLQIFLTATAGTAAVASLLQTVGHVKLAPRTRSSLGLLGSADANVAGGALMGAAMALSGSCPMTLPVQVALGLPSARWTLAGAALASVAWARPMRPWLARCIAATAPPADQTAAATLHEYVGLGPRAGLVILEALAAAVVWRSVAAAGPGAPADGPVRTGLPIAAAQLVSLLLRRSLLGNSSAFDELGDWFWWLVAGRGDGARPATPHTLLLTAGVMAAAAALASAPPAAALLGSGFPSSPLPSPSSLTPWRAALGGALMVFGSRVAKGCTSGHAISGVSQLSVASFLSAASACVAGVAVARLLQ